MSLATERAQRVERVTWDEFQENVFDWQQGQHVTLIGPTGCGKTTLVKELLIPKRRYIIFLGSKQKDDTQDDLSSRGGFRKTPSPTEIHPEISERWLVHPRFNRSLSAHEIKEVHRHVFQETLLRAYRDGNWCVIIDEARYVTDYLGLKDEAVLLWTQGRSQGNSVVAGVQRPRFIPMEAYDQASHLFFWRDPDIENVRRVSEMAGLDKAKMIHGITSLSRHEFLYIQPYTEQMVISQVPKESA